MQKQNLKKHQRFVLLDNDKRRSACKAQPAEKINLHLHNISFTCFLWFSISFTHFLCLSISFAYLQDSDIQAS